MKDPWDFVESLGVKHFKWDDPFFAEGNKTCHLLSKVPCIDLDDESVLHERLSLVIWKSWQLHMRGAIWLKQSRKSLSTGLIICSVPGCRQSFDTVAEHASHQHSCHSYSCITCKKSFPTHHLLDIHVAEMHDSYFYVMAQKKPMYRCLLETCTEVFDNSQDRKAHCIETHLFPSNFRYDLTWKKAGKVSCGKDKKSKQLASASSMECDSDGISDLDMMMKELPGKMESIFVKRPKDVPTKVSFGAGIQRGFHRHPRGRGRGKKPRNIRGISDNRGIETVKVDVNTGNVESGAMEDVMESVLSACD